MIKAVVITPRAVNWEGVFYPQVNDFLSEIGASWLMEDMTDQPTANMPTEPDLLTVEIKAEAWAIDAIDASGDYYVLWSEA